MSVATPPNTLTHVRRDEEREASTRPLSLRLMRRMFEYAAPYRKTMRWLLLVVLVRSAQGPILAWGLSAIINGPIYLRDVGALVGAMLAYTWMALFTQYTLYYRSLLALRLGEGVVHDLRNEFFTHLQKMSMGWFGRTKLGRIISRMTSDAESVRAGVQNVVFVGIVNLGQMSIAAAIMLWYDWVLFMAVLIVSPLFFTAYRFFRGAASKAQREVQESFSRVTATLAESVNGIRVTQSFVRQDVNAEMFRNLVVDHSGYNIAVARVSSLFLPTLDVLGQLMIALILVLASYRVLGGRTETTADNLFVFLFLASNFLEPVAILGTLYTTAVTAMAGAERVFGMLDRKPDYSDPPDAIDLRPIKGRVEFRDVSFGYEPPKYVLRDVSFVAEPGQTIALVGHTGSGKTTIINLISKFYHPSKGKLLIDGVDIDKIQGVSLHQQMSIVLQVNFLFSGTVMDNIRTGKPGASDDEVVDAVRKLETLDLLESLPNGLHTVVGEKGAGISLGQRQVICFARAMLADPRIMLLDEATSAVDSVTESRVQAALAKLLKGRTSFVVAHRLSTIRHADLVLVLDHGYIVERGTHTQLLATGGVYANLFRQFVRSNQA